MNVKKMRLTAESYDEASKRAWEKYPKALAIIISYLYCGWYDFEICGVLETE